MRSDRYRALHVPAQIPRRLPRWPPRQTGIFVLVGRPSLCCPASSGTHERRPAAPSHSHCSYRRTLMSTTTLASTSETSGTPPDLAAVKTRQHSAWSSGDYAVIGTTLQIVGEQLCEALDVRAGQKVLDVAAGNGNASLAAARRWCDVVATDYVP